MAIVRNQVNADAKWVGGATLANNAILIRAASTGRVDVLGNVIAKKVGEVCCATKVCKIGNYVNERYIQ